MEKTLLKIKILYDSFSKTEKKIADFVMENPRRLISLYITELADECAVSEATAVRFAKKLGFDGYQGLKLAVASETEVKPVSENIKKDDSAYKIFGKVCDDIYCSLEKTKNSIDGGALEKACEKILSADRIMIFGLGNSASVCIDAAHKMLRLGLNATAYTDNHMQAIAAAHADGKSVAIGVSHSGQSKDIVEALKTAKQNGATTVALTHKGKSPIDKASDIVLETVSDEMNYRILGLSSRIAQLAIVDTIYSYLACRLGKAEEEIAKTESALRQKKY